MSTKNATTGDAGCHLGVRGHVTALQGSLRSRPASVFHRDARALGLADGGEGRRDGRGRRGGAATAADDGDEQQEQQGCPPGPGEGGR